VTSITHARYQSPAGSASTDLAPRPANPHPTLKASPASSERPAMAPHHLPCQSTGEANPIQTRVSFSFLHATLGHWHNARRDELQAHRIMRETFLRTVARNCPGLNVRPLAAIAAPRRGFFVPRQSCRRADYYGTCRPRKTSRRSPARPRAAVIQRLESKKPANRRFRQLAGYFSSESRARRGKRLAR